MVKVTPYLFFENKAAEAMTFYKNIFGGELFIQKVSESPMKDSMSAEVQDSMLHAALTGPGVVLYASDLIDGSKASQGNTTELCVECDSKDQFQEYWDKLMQGGKEIMPVKDEFFWNLWCIGR